MTLKELAETAFRGHGPGRVVVFEDCGSSQYCKCDKAEWEKTHRRELLLAVVLEQELSAVEAHAALELLS